MLELLVKYDKFLKCWKLFVIDENDQIVYRPTANDMYFSKDLLKHTLGVK